MQKRPPGGVKGTVCTSSAVNWWMRSGNSATQFRNVNTNGNANNNNATNGNNWQRPAMTKLFEAVMGDGPLIQRFNALPRRKEGYRGPVHLPDPDRL